MAAAFVLLFIVMAASGYFEADAAFLKSTVSAQLKSIQPPNSFFSDLFPFSPSNNPDSKIPVENSDEKSSLMELLAQVPPNQSTSKELTSRILDAVKVLENSCPTPDEDVLSRLVGNWELIWTAQDVDNLPGGTTFFANWINPLENQSYSNNPTVSGRSNPILPQNMQNTFEDIGVLADRKLENTIKSTQSIDLKRKRVRNVVAFEANNPTPVLSKNGKTKGFITVDVRCEPNPGDSRRIDVKFDRCSVAILDSPVDISFPLGLIGPTGWLRTGFIDNEIRITRGHKGSVFILSRTIATR